MVSVWFVASYPILYNEIEWNILHLQHSLQFLFEKNLLHRLFINQHKQKRFSFEFLHPRSQVVPYWKLTSGQTLNVCRTKISISLILISCNSDLLCYHLTPTCIFILLNYKIRNVTITNKIFFKVVFLLIPPVTYLPWNIILSLCWLHEDRC